MGTFSSRFETNEEINPIEIPHNGEANNGGGFVEVSVITKQYILSGLEPKYLEKHTS